MMSKYKGRGVVQITGRNAGKSHWTNVAIQRLMEDLAAQPLTNIILSEGKVYGSIYYCAEPIGGNWLDMDEWCCENFGTDSHPIWGEPRVPEPAQRWYKNNRQFWFKSEADRLMFVLKWR